jgi:hypothetical protein
LAFEYFEFEGIIFLSGSLELCFGGLSAGEEGEAKIVEGLGAY